MKVGNNVFSLDTSDNKCQKHEIIRAVFRISLLQFGLLFSQFNGHTVELFQISIFLVA